MPTLRDFEFFGVDITNLTSEQLDALGYVTPANELPTVVDGPGQYLTRDGRVATVHEIEEPTRSSITSFTVKGSLVMHGRVRASYTTWHRSGRRWGGYRESGSDLVRKL